MDGLRRCWPSVAIFVGVQTVAAGWIVSEVHVSAVPETLAHTVGGPLNLLLRLDRLARYGQYPRDAFLVLGMILIAVLPWAHAWRPRRVWLGASLLGSLLWAAAGFGFGIDHL